MTGKLKPAAQVGESAAFFLRKQVDGTRFQVGTKLYAQETLDELIAAMEEVLRISDRKHDAWDKVKAMIAEIKQ